MDKAQAVVQEIEEIKQKEAQEAQQEQKKFDDIMAIAYKTLALKETFRLRSRSASSGKNMPVVANFADFHGRVWHEIVE